jgi:hypothetical protein
MAWRKTNRNLHRDLGYFTAGLTIIYALSGLAVNHMEDWNPSYDITHLDVAMGTIDTEKKSGNQRLDFLQERIVAHLRLDEDIVRGRLDQGPESFKIFLEEGGEVVVNPKDGSGRVKIVKKRAFLFDFNALHLNSLKGWWTYAADVFACILLFLAASGIVMLPGKQGFMGRGKWLISLGLLVPVFAVIFG